MGQFDGIKRALNGDTTVLEEQPSPTNFVQKLQNAQADVTQAKVEKAQEVFQKKQNIAHQVTQQKIQQKELPTVSLPSSTVSEEDMLKPLGPQPDPTAVESFDRQLEEDLSTTDTVSKEKLLDSIYTAEGKKGARIPYGMFTKEFERRVAAGEEISEAEARAETAKHLDRHIKRWEAGGTRSDIDKAEERGLINANPEKNKAVIDGKWSPAFINWYGEIYSPAHEANTNLSSAEQELNRNWITNVSSNIEKGPVYKIDEAPFTTSGIDPATAPTDISEDFLGQQDTRHGLQPQPVVEADPTIPEQLPIELAYKKILEDLEQVQQLQLEKGKPAEEIKPDIPSLETFSEDFIGQQDTRPQLETPKAVKPSTPTEIIKSFQVPESPDVAPIEPSDIEIPGGAAAKLVDTKQKKIAVQQASPIEAEIKKTEISEATPIYGFQGQLHDELTTMGREPVSVPTKPVDKEFKPAVDIDRRDPGKDRERAEARQREIAEFKKIDEELKIQSIEDTSLSEQEQRDLALKTEAKIPKKVEEKIKEDPTLEIPKTDPAVYGNPNIPVNLMPDLNAPYSPDYLRELSDALSAVDITAPGLRGLSAPNYMEPTSPAVQTDGRVSAHADGTWSVRVADGSVLPGLDEVTAKSFSAYQAADVRARDLGAPTSTLGNYFNMFMQSWAIPAEMGFSAFTGATTLTQQVDDYNTFRDRSGDTTAITPEEVAQYKAGTLSEEHPNFQALTQLHNQAQVNRKQLQSIHEEAQKYRDAFPVNDADYQGAIAAAEVIQKYKGTGAAIWHSVSNDLGTMMEQGIASIGFMVALTAGGPPMQLAMLTMLAKGRANQAIDEFVTRTGKEPTTEERSRINWSSAAGLVAEKVSAGVLVKVIGKFPGIGGQLAWTKKMKAAVDTNNKSFKNGLLYRGVVAPIGGLASEAQQGAATSFFEQYAQTGTADIDKIGMAAYYEAVATPGAAGGMIVTSGAYGAGKGVTRKIFGIDKAENKAKLQRGLARIESELAKITKLENINKAIEEQGPLSAAAEKEKDALGGVILFGDLADSEKLGFDPKAAELKKKWEETKAKIAEIEETGKVSGEQFELGFEDTETTLSETAKKQLATLRRQEQVLYAQLLTPVSIEVETKIRTAYRKNLEKALGRNKDLLKEGKFSFRHLEKKYAEFIAIDKGEIDPDAGKPIEDSELNKILDEMGVTPKPSTLQKLRRVAKRGLTPEQKTKIGKILDKSLDKALDVGESVFSIFGSNFLEGSLDPDKFTDEQLKAEQDKAKTPEDKAAIQKIRDLKALQEQLKKEDSSTIDKDLEQVETEVLEGKSARWKGIDTYRKEILKLFADNPDPSARGLERLGKRITKIKDLMRNHADNLHRKFLTFQAAQDAYNKLTSQEIKDGKGIIVIGKRVESATGLRTMEYTIAKKDGKPLALTDTEFQEKRKKGLKSRKAEERQYTFRIGENSSKLIKALSNEAAFGEAAVSIVEGYQDTSYNTLLEQQKSERLANKELTEMLEEIKAGLSVPTKEASKKDIDDVVLETGETAYVEITHTSAKGRTINYKVFADGTIKSVSKAGNEIERYKNTKEGTPQDKTKQEILALAAKKRGETTDADSKKKPGEQLDLFPEGTLPEGKTPVSSKAPKTTPEVTEPLKPGEKGYQYTLFDEKAEEESPTTDPINIYRDTDTKIEEGDRVNVYISDELANAKPVKVVEIYEEGWVRVENPDGSFSTAAINEGDSYIVLVEKPKVESKTVKEKVHAVIDGIIQFFGGATKAKQYAIDHSDSAVYTLRVNKKDGDSIPHVTPEFHFGNPWSAKGYTGLDFKTDSVQEAVDNYEAWLNNKDTEIEPERRQWILDQIESDLFDTRDLLYFKKADISHAKVLAKRIAARKSTKKAPTTVKAPTTIQNFIAAVAETYKTVITKADPAIKNIGKNIENILGIVGKKFLDLVDLDVTSPGINTLTDANFASSTALTDALVELGLSEDGAKILTKRFIDFRKRYEKIVSSKSMPAFAIKRPLTILMRENPRTGKEELPNQVLFAMMISTMIWSKQNSGDTVRFRSNYDREEFLYGGNGKLKGNDYEQLENLGADYTQTINRLGRQIQKILRVTKKDLREKDPDITDGGINLYYQNLGVDLGIVAVQIAETEIDNSGTGHIFSIEEHTWAFKGKAKVEGRRFNNGPEKYRHIVTNDEAPSLTPKEIEALDDINEINKSDIDANDHQTLKSPPSVSDTIKNVLTKIPAKVKFRLKTLQNTPWSAAESMGIFSKLASNGHTQLLYELAGYQAFDPDTVMAQEAKSLESQNSDKTTAIDEILEAFDNGGENNQLKKFYFKYELQNQHRILMQGRINPQNSKVSRFLLQSWGPTKYNKKNLWMFKLAIAQNLGFKIDKKDYKTSALEFDKIVADPIILKAVAALTALDKAKDEKTQQKHAAALAKVLPEIKAKYEVAHGTSILNALTGLSKYKPDSTFESDVVMEIDGISNGWAMNVLQFPMFGTNLERIFGQVGIYFGANTKHDTDQQDVYETLVEIMKDFMGADSAWGYETNRLKKEGLDKHEIEEMEEEYISTYNKRDAALTQLYPDLKNGDLRSLVKYPFLIYMYGGGIERISNDVAGDIVTSINSQLSRMQREYNDLNNPTPELKKQLEKDLAAREIVARSQEDYLKEVVEPYFDNLKAFNIETTVNPDGSVDRHGMDAIDNKFIEAFKSNDTNIYKLELNESFLQDGIAKVLAPRFDGALDKMLGETKEARNAVIQMGEILHSVFITHFDKAYEKALKETKRSSLTKTEIDDLILSETTKLMEVYPQYVGPLSQIKDGIIEGGIDLTKRDTSKTPNTPERVAHNFKDGDKTSNPSKLEFVAPGVSALIRQIINMDSVLLTLTLGKHPEMLALHDAFMGSPAQLVEAAKDYNADFLKFGREHSVIQQTYEQVLDVIATAESNGLMGAVDKHIKENAFANTFIKDAKSKKGYKQLMFRDPKLKKGKKDTSITATVNRVKVAREKLEALIKKHGGKISAYQMYMPTEELVGAVKSVTDDLMGKVEDKLETWMSKHYKPKKRKIHQIKKGDRLLKVIAKLGGILQDESEDLGLVYEGYASAPSGLGRGFPVVHKTPKKTKEGHHYAGHGGDQMVVFLQEEGWLKEDADTDTLNKMIQEEMSGNIQRPLDYDYSEELEESLKKHEEEEQAKEEADKKLRATPTDELTEEQLEQLGLGPLDPEDFGSLDDLPKSDSRTVLESGLTTNTITDLFNKVKEYSVNYYNSKQEMDDHTSVLEDVLGILGGGLTETSNLSFALEQINGITQGTYETKRNHIRVSVARQMPLSIGGQSPQEVYTHELVHAMTWQAIQDNPLLADNIAALYRQVEADLKTNPEFKGEGWRVFLPEGIGKPSANDIATAKQQYKYVFDNPKQEAHKLHEFLAYAVTNKQMINYLKTQPSAIRKDWIGKLLRAVEMVVNTFKRMFGKAVSKESDKNGFEQMLAITEHLVAIQSKHQSKVQQLQSKTYDFLDEADQKIKDFSKLQARKILKSDAKTRIGAVAQGFVGASVHILSENATAQRVRKFATQNLTKTLRGVANEIGGGALSEEMIEQLLHAKVNISKARQETERSTIQWFNGDNAEGIDSIWKSVDPKDNHSMSVELKEALTDVLFKTDLSSLLTAGFTHAEIKDFISSKDSVNDAQKTIKRRLKRIQSDGFRPSIRYAEELGYHIATGKTKLTAAHMNAHTIAAKYLKTPNEEQIGLLDAYATLESLKHIDPRKARDVRNLANNEFVADSKQNGIIDMLDSHLAYKEDSQIGLFRDNPTQMVKGYIVERVDNLTSTKVGTAADAEKMKRAGYHESYPLGKIDPNQTYDTLYVSRHMPEVTDVSGILSTTNQRNMGTTLTEIFMRDPAYEVNGKPDFFLIKQKVKAFIDAEDRKSDPNSATFLQEDDSLNLRPVMDETGRITDYRVMMDHETTKKLLKPDMEIQNVFAHMNSSLIDKQASLENNLETIDILVDEQLDLFESHPKEFTNILDPEGAYIERYYKLPKSVRDRIQSYAVDGKFMIREDIIDKVFGYKSFDISQLKRLDGHPRTKYVAALAHYMIKQIVGYGKDRIVIGMPQVVFSNLFSNISQLSMRKIPISYTFYKIVEGLSEYKKYRSAHEERARLQQLKRSKNLSDNSPEAKQIQRLDAQIQNNTLHKMSAAGLNSLIVEDINDAQTDGYFNRMRRMLRLESFQYKNYTDRIPKKVGTAANWLFLTKSSKPYQVSRHIVQLTDFLGRYVMIEHATKVKGQSFKEAMHEALNAFVLFDEALVPALEAIDAVGATSFLSYFLRNQRASKQLVQTSPTSVALSAGIQYTTGIPTLGNVNASWLAGDVSPNMLQFDDLFDEANNATGFEVVAWFQGLFN